MSEKSCGLVIFRQFTKGWRVLIAKQINNMWSFVKGHVENKESEIETALREAKEEVNLENFQIFKETRMKEKYVLPNGIPKEVVYFLAIQTDKKDPRRQESEILEMKYYSCSRAMNKLVHNSQKRVLKTMYKKLNQHLLNQIKNK